MYKLAYVALAILMGIICYIIAKRRGAQNPGLWFIGGVLFNLIAVGAAMLLSDHLKKKGVTK